MFWVFATRQLTAVVGAVSVREAVPATTAKLALDVAELGEARSITGR